jgi:signal transduction histidine kinase
MVTGERDLSRLAAQLLTVNERNEQLIEGLLVFAESDRGLPGTEPVRLDALVGEVLDRFAEEASRHAVTVLRVMRERARHTEITLATNMAICFCDPTRPGSVDRTRTPTACSASTSPKAPSTPPTT